MDRKTFDEKVRECMGGAQATGNKALVEAVLLVAQMLREAIHPSESAQVPEPVKQSEPNPVEAPKAEPPPLTPTGEAEAAQLAADEKKADAYGVKQATVRKSK